MKSDPSETPARGRVADAGAPKTPLDTQEARLMEANQRLVVAALQSQAVAEKATERLGDITHASQRDALTGLPGRALLKDRLGRALGMAQRHAAQSAVMFIDVDHFKHINDTFGHTVGDEALKLVAQRLEAVVRHSDTVSRHSGDEFVVLLAEISQHSDAAHIARKMLAAVAAPCLPVDLALSLSVSIGIAMYPGDGLHADSLIANADTAMYRSKKAGGGQFHFYNAAIDEAESEWIGETRPLPLVDMTLTQSLSDKYNDVLEANEHLQIASAATQESLDGCVQAHLRRLDLLTDVAHALHDPGTARQMEANLRNRAGTEERRDSQAQALAHDHVAQLVRKVDDLLEATRANAITFRR